MNAIVRKAFKILGLEYKKQSAETSLRLLASAVIRQPASEDTNLAVSGSSTNSKVARATRNETELARGVLLSGLVYWKFFPELPPAGLFKRPAGGCFKTKAQGVANLLALTGCPEAYGLEGPQIQLGTKKAGYLAGFQSVQSSLVRCSIVVQIPANSKVWLVRVPEIYGGIDYVLFINQRRVVACRK